jgi:hypothetical protein
VSFAASVDASLLAGLVLAMSGALIKAAASLNPNRLFFRQVDKKVVA